MVGTRVGIIAGSFGAIAKSAMMSIRYAVCRRQFKTVKGSTQERKLLDYQSHMAILGPHLASEFIIMFIAKTMSGLIE